MGNTLKRFANVTVDFVSARTVLILRRGEPKATARTPFDNKLVVAKLSVHEPRSLWIIGSIQFDASFWKLLAKGLQE